MKPKPEELHTIETLEARARKYGAQQAKRDLRAKTPHIPLSPSATYHVGDKVIIQNRLLRPISSSYINKQGTITLYKSAYGSSTYQVRFPDGELRWFRLDYLTPKV